MADSLFPFEAVPRRFRRDGWTAERQRAFVDLIAAGFRPGRAAARIGMRRQGAYELRERAGGASFAAAWDAAAESARRRRIGDRSGRSLYARAVEGVPRPVRHRGRVVAVVRRFDDAALVRLLGMLDSRLRKAGSGRRGIFSPMDAATLSASAHPERRGGRRGKDRRATIGGGESDAHPLEDVASAEHPE